MRGFDASNFSGVPDKAAVRALCCSEGFSFGIIACQFPDTFNPWAEATVAANATVEAYLELYDGSTVQSQLEQRYALVHSVYAEILWLAIEDQFSFTQEQAAELDSILAGNWEVPELGIYTRKGYWLEKGNYQFGKYCRLWDANYDNDPTISDVNYGGWVRPTVKQYAADYKSYGLTVDLNVR